MQRLTSRSGPARPARTLLSLICLGGITFATVRVAQAFASPSRSSYGADAVLLTLSVAAIFIRICIDLTGIAPRRGGLSTVLTLSAALMAGLVSLASVLDGFNVTDAIAVAVALVVILLNLLVSLVWG